MKNSELKEGDKFKIDTNRVDQYEETRIVDMVTIEQVPQKYAKKVIVYLPSLRASHFVPINELKPIDAEQIKYYESLYPDLYEK